MHDRFRKRYKVPPASARLRHQIALEAARRMFDAAAPNAEPPDAGDEAGLESLADHLDRFAIYKMRLEPLEAIKQTAKHHPEGDALYHSLQVFALARDA